MELLNSLIGHEVVLDMIAPYVYLGRLSSCDMHYLVLDEADVHDLRDTTTTRENYVVDSRRLGIRTNRQRVLVRLDQVISVSRLDAVIL